MPTTTPKEVIRVGTREVVITNPQKVLFPDVGHTKLDLVQYYLFVADGALRGSGGRPNIMVRFPNGVGSEFFFQKRAPKDRPPWVEVVTIRFPSGRSAEEVADAVTYLAGEQASFTTGEILGVNGGGWTD